METRPTTAPNLRVNLPINFITPLPGASFGGWLTVAGDAKAFIEAAEQDPDTLAAMLGDCHGLLVIAGMSGLAAHPELLVRLSCAFGPEVENYRQTGMAGNMVHPDIPEILVVSNVPPVSRTPPALPDPPLTDDGRLPTQYPHRRGWHTDQSYRRPPPDISLFLGVQPAPRGQAQTLFADATAAYAALSPELKSCVDSLRGLHVGPGTGRRRDAMMAGQTPRPLAPHEQPQPQPVVRVHPVTGERALYLCEYGQMDWFEGPFVGLEPGPHGDGARLLDTLMTHMTQPAFTYVHEWTAGDLLVWDNRNTVHTATWFDASHVSRIMWRTTVSGNPGAEYVGQEHSWLRRA